MSDEASADWKHVCHHMLEVEGIEIRRLLEILFRSDEADCNHNCLQMLKMRVVEMVQRQGNLILSDVDSSDLRD